MPQFRISYKGFGCCHGPYSQYHHSGLFDHSPGPLYSLRPGYLTAILTGPLNRLVYYIAIPAMIFRVIAEAPLRTNFNALLLGGTLLATLLIFALALLLGLLFSLKRTEMGTFLEFHARELGIHWPCRSVLFPGEGGTHPGQHLWPDF